MLLDHGADPSSLSGDDIIKYQLGHNLYKKYYFHKSHECMDNFGLRVEYLFKAEEYDLISRIMAEKCGMPFGEKPEMRTMADILNYCHP